MEGTASGGEGSARPRHFKVHSEEIQREARSLKHEAAGNIEDGDCKTFGCWPGRGSDG